MENSKLCQVAQCSWPVVLCPELCAPHWWAITKPSRAAILRAQIRGQKDGTHPNVDYQNLIRAAIKHLDGLGGSRAKYERQPGDVDTRHARLTHCIDCQRQVVHCSFIRDGEPGLFCFACLTMIPAIPAGAHVLPGMEPTP